MSSNNDLSFHIPAAGLGAGDAVGSPNANMFSRLHLAGNSDWMSSFSSSQQVAAARPILAPPAPVAAAASSSLASGRPLTAPAAIDASAARSSTFLSMFYRAPPTSIGEPTPAAATAATGAPRASGLLRMPAPPKALDALDSPPQRAMPVDAELSLEHFAKLGTVDAAMPSIRREPPRPLAVGSDTWNALSGIPLPRKAMPSVSSMAASPVGAAARVLAPPTSVDGVAGRCGPKPLWADLSLASRFRATAPTLDAFRAPSSAAAAAAPVEVSTSPMDGPLLQSSTTTATMTHGVPVPPMPLMTSPLRSISPMDDPETSAQVRAAPMAHPLVPVGEEAAAPVTPLLRQADVAAPAPRWSCETDGTSSPVLADFVKSVTEPSTQREAKEEARAAANVRNFLSTLFSRGEEAETSRVASPTPKADSFNALELATNRSSSVQAKSNPLVDYSTFFNTALFEDDNDEDSDEGLERLRHVVSIVMQSAKSGEGLASPGNAPAASHTGRRPTSSSMAPTTTKYTEFTASYQTTHRGTGNNSTGGEGEWLQHARF